MRAAAATCCRPGLIAYLQLLGRFQQRTQVLVELPWVAHDPWADVPAERRFGAAVLRVLHSLRVRRAVLVGHSFGSFPVVWTFQQQQQQQQWQRQEPQALQLQAAASSAGSGAAIALRLVLLDPVCLCLTHPALARNALAVWPKGVFHMIARYFGLCELGFARAIFQHFIW